MPVSPEMREYLEIKMASTPDRSVQDGLLDLFLEYSHMATEWDAYNWGLLPRYKMRALNRALGKLRVCPECGRDH